METARVENFKYNCFSFMYIKKTLGDPGRKKRYPLKLVPTQLLVEGISDQ